MNTPYTIAVTYHAKPGRRENFLRQLSAEGVIDTIRAERGCLQMCIRDSFVCAYKTIQQYNTNAAPPARHEAILFQEIVRRASYAVLIKIDGRN